MKFGPLVIGTALAGVLLLAGCDDHHHDTQTTVGAIATDQVKNKTCEQGTPEDVNELTIVDSDAAIDVSTLTPGCASGS